MGNFYVNYTVRGATSEAVAGVLKGRSSIVTPAVNETVVVFDEESDTQNEKVISALGRRMSQELKCAVWAVLNHDDDIFWYQLHVNGEKHDEYNSCPGYFDSSAESVDPSGGDAEKLCSAFGSDNVGDVERILRTSSLEGYTFEFERHSALVEALGVSSYGVGVGYSYFEEGDLPEGLSGNDVIRT